MFRPSTASPAPVQPPAFNPRQVFRSLLPTVILPLALYQLLPSRGVPTVPALTATAVFPLGATVLDWVRTRRLNVVGVVVLVFIILGVATSLLSDDPRFFLIKESFATGAWALLCFGSLLLAPRPLLFYFSRQFVSGGDPQAAARFDALWQYPAFRFYQRIVTVVWGCAYLVEAILRLALSFLLPISLFLVASPLMGIGVTIALIAWTVSYGRRLARRRRGAELQPTADPLGDT